MGQPCFKNGGDDLGTAFDEDGGDLSLSQGVQESGEIGSILSPTRQEENLHAPGRRAEAFSPGASGEATMRV